MPTFQTPEPVSLDIDIEAGDITVTASARSDTTVDVQPGNPNKQDDVEAAEETRVDQHDGTIVVKGPRTNGRGRTPEVRITVELPEGSNLRTKTASGDLVTGGRLGDVHAETASGDIRIATAGTLNAKAASGDVTCRTTEGDARVSTASGDIGLESIGGNGFVTAASGDIEVDEVGGNLRVTSASGDSTVGTVEGSDVSAESASGDVRIRSVRQGRVSVQTASGDVWVGVAAGTAAWLELQSLTGDVRSGLEGADDAGSAEKTVELRVQTISGDIAIDRAR